MKLPLQTVCSKPVSFRMFSNIWREECSQIVLMKPRSDLCSFYQKNFTSGSTMELTAIEEENIETLKKISLHLETF